MSGWEKIGAGGAFLAMAGSLVAFAGVLQLAAGLSVSMPRPLRRLQAWFRKVTGRTPPDVGASPTDAERMTDSVNAKMFEGTPPSYATMERVVKYIDQEVGRVRDELLQERQLRQSEAAYDRELANAGVIQAFAHTDQRFGEVRAALVGDRGGGLWVAAFGLLLTFVGGGMQFFAAINVG